jgi:hypothetical protein
MTLVYLLKDHYLIDLGVIVAGFVQG